MQLFFQGSSVQQPRSSPSLGIVCYGSLFTLYGPPMDRGPWRATIHGVLRVGHNSVAQPPITLHVLFTVRRLHHVCSRGSGQSKRQPVSTHCHMRVRHCFPRSSFPVTGTQAFGFLLPPATPLYAPSNRCSQESSTGGLRHSQPPHAALLVRYFTAHMV